MIAEAIANSYKGQVFLEFKVSLVNFNFPQKLNLNLQENGSTYNFSVKTVNEN